MPASKVSPATNCVTSPPKASAERTNIGAITQTDFGYTGQRKLDSGMGGLMDYKARFYSPYLNRFIQPDSLIPDPVNPQAWNRYSYTLGNPIKYNDPSGHGVDCGIGMGCVSPFVAPTGSNSGGSGGSTSENGGGDPVNYTGPLPDAIIEQLGAQGADPDFLALVIIHNKQDDEWRKYCYPEAAAVTWYDTIYFCNTDSKYYDPNKPTAVLLHELIHVSQFNNNSDELFNELNRIGDLKKRDKTIEWWNTNWPGRLFGAINWENYNPYRSSWVEVQGKNCQLAFKNNPAIPLNIPPCNLAPFE